MSDDEKGAMLINLAASLAASDSHVLLVDACLVPSGVLSRFGGFAVATLLDVARQECHLDDALRFVPEGFALVRLSRKTSSTTMPVQVRLAEIVDSLAAESDVTLINGELSADDALPVSAMEMGKIVIHVSPNPGAIKAAYVLLKSLNEKFGCRSFNLLVSGGVEAEAKMVYANMAQAANRYLAAQLNFMGVIPTDENIHRALRQGRTVLEVFPSSGAAMAFRRLANYFPLSSFAKGSCSVAADGVSLGV